MLAQWVLQPSETLVVRLLKHRRLLPQLLVCTHGLYVDSPEDVLERLILRKDKHVRHLDLLLAQTIVVSKLRSAFQLRRLLEDKTSAERLHNSVIDGQLFVGQPFQLYDLHVLVRLTRAGHRTAVEKHESFVQD
jgi:hypothetical protein